MTIFRFSVLALIIILGIFGLLAIQQRRAMQADFAFAKQAAQVCGMPVGFVRLNQDADRDEPSVNVGKLWFGCEADEKRKLKCFEQEMAKSEIRYANSNVMGSCMSISPVPVVFETKPVQ